MLMCTVPPKTRQETLVGLLRGCTRLVHRRCHEKTSYVPDYAFFTLLHEWVGRGQTH